MTETAQQAQKCQQHGCKEDAVAIAHWQGKDTMQCLMHCNGLDRLSKLMGFGKLLFTDLATGINLEIKP